MTTPVSKTAQVTAATNAKLLATIEQTAAAAAVAALTSADTASAQAKARRRLAIANQRKDQETQALIFANQLP